MRDNSSHYRNDVSTFYNDFTDVSGIEGVSKEQSKAIAKTIKYRATSDRYVS